MNILAIGAHPDDIEFGCGGALMRYAQKKNNIYLLILTSGEVGGEPGLRRCEQQKAASLMKVKKVYWGDFEDTDIPRDRSVIIALIQTHAAGGRKASRRESLATRASGAARWSNHRSLVRIASNSRSSSSGRAAVRHTRTHSACRTASAAQSACTAVRSPPPW